MCYPENELRRSIRKDHFFSVTEMSASSTDMGNGKNDTNREPDTKLENVFFFINGVFIEHRKLTVLQKKGTTGGGG